MKRLAYRATSHFGNVGQLRVINTSTSPIARTSVRIKFMGQEGRANRLPIKLDK
jgi:hypothetical protein